MIYINDQSYPLEGSPSLNNLFAALQINISKGVAIAVNNTVISKSEWDKYEVKQNDRILMIKATQGG